MVQQKSFYLLEPFQSYPASNAKEWLGRVVSDYRRPVAGYTPTTTLPFTLEHHDDPNFSNVSAILEAISSDSIKVSFLEIFGISLEDYKTKKHAAMSQRVQRLRVHNDALLLDKMLEQADVLADLDKWGFSIFCPFYLIVGLLVTKDIVYATNESSHHGVDAKLDPAQIAGLVTVAPIPLQSTIISDTSRGSQARLGTRATGQRIFAIEYRSFRKRLIQYGPNRADLKGYGPKGDRTFAASSDTYSTGPLSASHCEMQISLDAEDFSEIIETDCDDDEDSMCFSLACEDN
jgi:hypothetical protein